MECAVQIAAVASPIVTIVVGLFAFIIYRKQKHDNRKSAANIVLLEIQHIEKAVKRTRDALYSDNINNIELDIVRDDVWSKYGHLFTNSLDNDEWELTSNFFQDAKLLDEAVKKSRESFNEDVAQIRVNKQRVIADLAKNIVNDPTEELIKLFSTQAAAFDKLYMSAQEQHLYTPMKYTTDARHYCENLGNISSTSVGIKLKKIIGKR